MSNTPLVSTSNTPLVSDQPTPKEPGLSNSEVTGIILGVLFAVLIATVIVAVIALFINRRRKSRSYTVEVSYYLSE